MKSRKHAGSAVTAAWAPAVALVIAMAPAIDAVAAEPIAATAQQPLRDPWVPPEARRPSQAHGPKAPRCAPKSSAS